MYTVIISSTCVYTPTALIGVFLLSGVCLALSSSGFDLYGYYNNLQVIV